MNGVPTYLTREWLQANGWVKALDVPFFQNDRETIASDLCVLLNRKEYLKAEYHNQGDDAYKPEAQPTTIIVQGLNSRIEMEDISLTNLVMAVSICGMGKFEQIQKAIGGIYDMTMQRKPEPLKVKVTAKKTFTLSGIGFKRGLHYPVDNIEIWADIHETPDFETGCFNKFAVGYKHRKVSVKGGCGIVDFYDERTARMNYPQKPCFDDYFEELDMENVPFHYGQR